MQFTLPPVPTWESSHVLLVHLPLGVLPVVPLLAVAAMFGGRHRLPLAFCTVVLLLVGATGAFLAASSGNAAEHASVIPQAARQVFRLHERTGDQVRNFVLIIAAVYAVFFAAACVWGQRIKPIPWMVAHAVFIAVHLLLVVALLNTGHLGGRLVHEFGVRAPFAGAMDSQSGSPEQKADGQGRTSR